ncbi:MAG TPA: T9SS type A sorting domain-containing protein, partial [Flavobacterium sp.]
STLMPFETREIYLVFNINAPTEIPPVNIGDQLNFTAVIDSALEDESENDNISKIKQTVVGSMDPNDKVCLEGDIVAPDMIGEYVHYMIRFENAGSYPAQNVVVKDMIDTSKFDIATLVPISASHPFETRISHTNKVEFIFENIMLPFDDATNDGYVAFKINTLPTLVVGDTFSNAASIYFDYNFPIETNTATTTIQQLATSDFEIGDFFTLYPNPAKDVLNIKTSNEAKINSVSFYNTLGQLIMVVTGISTDEAIDVSHLNAESYFIKINSSKGNTNSKFLKE